MEINIIPDRDEDVLLLDALKAKCDALKAYEENPTKETQRMFLKAVDFYNYVKENF